MKEPSPTPVNVARVADKRPLWVKSGHGLTRM